jgi:Domain of unknown function (DUF892)
VLGGIYMLIYAACRSLPIRRRMSTRANLPPENHADAAEIDCRGQANDGARNPASTAGRLKARYPSTKYANRRLARSSGLANGITERSAPGPVLDAGLFACAQAVEHYEMTRYGALGAWAEQLDMEDAGELLEETLDEEKAADEKLPELADDINPEANEDEEEKDDDQDERPRKAGAKL